MLVEIFGNYPQIKVLDYLLMNPFGKYTKQQIAVGSEISRITLNTFIGEIIEKNILIKDNNSRLFLNLDSPIVKILNRTLDDFNILLLCVNVGLFELIRSIAFLGCYEACA